MFVYKGYYIEEGINYSRCPLSINLEINISCYTRTIRQIDYPGYLWTSYNGTSCPGNLTNIAKYTSVLKINSIFRLT